MATATDEIYVKILTDTNQAIVGMTNFMSSIAKAAAALYAFKKVVIDSFKSYQEAEVAEARLAAAMKITGQASEAGLRNLTAYAKGLQRTTTYSDEANMSAMGLLMQIGNLSEQGVKKALPLLQDYASVMGIDLTTAAEQLGQAIAGGRNMFQKYGIELKDTMSASQKFDAVMVGLSDKFGGFERQLAQTTSGQIKVLKNLIDELKESLGGLLAQFMNPILKNTITLLSGEMTIARPLISYKAKDDILQSLSTLQEYKKQLEGLNDWIDKSPLKAFWYQMFGKNADLMIGDINNRISDLTSIMRGLKDATSGTAGNINDIADSLGKVAMVAIPQSGYGKNPLWAGEQQEPSFQSLPGGMGGGIPSFAEMGYGDLERMAIAAEKSAYSGEKVMKWTVRWAGAIAELEKQAAYAIGGSLGDLFSALGTAAATGEGAGEAFAKFVTSIMNQIGQLMLVAGLKLIIEGGPAMMGLGIALAIAGGVTMFAGAFFGASSGGGGNTAAPELPYMASGGIVSRPTLAMIGESGPEAVVPLGRGFGRGTTIIVQGSVWAERDLASVVAAAQGNW